MLASEWKRPGVLNHFTIVRKLDVWPVKFQTKVEEKNTKAGSTILHFETRHFFFVNIIFVESMFHFTRNVKLQNMSHLHVLCF